MPSAGRPSAAASSRGCASCARRSPRGGTAVGKRQKLVDAFARDDGPPFFVLSLKAGGTGLNLTAASHVLHFDRWWNPAVENQATDRAYRIGQHRNVLVHKFVCRGTVEERIDELIRSKVGLSAEILGGGEELPLTERCAPRMRRRRCSYGSIWAPYVPVAERRREAAHLAATRTKDGRAARGSTPSRSGSRSSPRRRGDRCATTVRAKSRRSSSGCRVVSRMP